MMLYLGLEAALVLLSAILIRRRLKTEWAFAVHYALLISYSLQGLLSVGLALGNKALSVSALSWQIAVLTAMVGGCLIATKPAHIGQEPRPNGHATSLAVLFSYAAATFAGLAFFTLDLVPSSMTGDPPRHFLLLFNPGAPGPVLLSKPIYYIWAGIFSHLPLPPESDRLFVASNIFTLGIVTCGVTLLATKIIRPLAWPHILLVAVLTAFGYPYFSLQYGYYTLLLSSAFLFFSIAFLFDYVTSNTRHYLLGSLLFIGIPLTHAYLAPTLFLLLGSFFLYRNYRLQLAPLPELTKHLPYWLGLVAVTHFSNSFFGSNEGVQALTGIVRVNGYGTGNLFGNVLPFSAFAIPYLVRNDPTDRSHSLLIGILCSSAVTILLFELSQTGRVAPYYVNRSLIVLLPLLTIAVAGTLNRIARSHLRISASVCVVICLAVAAPYLTMERTPLAFTKTRFLALLAHGSGFLYSVMPKISEHSPLEMTYHDIELLTHIAAGCPRVNPENITVLGTDHEVLWLEIYTSAERALAKESETYISQSSNVARYLAWKNGSGPRQIAVIDHMLHLVPEDIIRDLKASSFQVCRGDSFSIYEQL